MCWILYGTLLYNILLFICRNKYYSSLIQEIATKQPQYIYMYFWCYYIIEIIMHYRGSGSLIVTTYKQFNYVYLLLLKETCKECFSLYVQRRNIKKNGFFLFRFIIWNYGSWRYHYSRFYAKEEKLCLKKRRSLSQTSIENIKLQKGVIIIYFLDKLYYRLFLNDIY